MSLLQEKVPSEELAALLAGYEGRGGIVEFVIFGHDAPRLSEPELHREAAIATLRVFADRNERYFAQPDIIQLFVKAGLNPNDHFRIGTEPEKAKGRQITVADFVGPLFDAPSRRLLLRGRTRSHLNDYFLADDEERPDTVRQVPHYANEGFAYAFTEPPYSMSGTRNEINALFLSLNTLLFNDFQDALVIYQWSTDWSTYFDAGHEWWGAFLWTVHNPKAHFMIGVGASTTD